MAITQARAWDAGRIWQKVCSRCQAACAVRVAPFGVWAALWLLVGACGCLLLPGLPSLRWLLPMLGVGAVLWWRCGALPRAAWAWC